ncbi:c-type cytochrome [Pigmentiphaga kullae]|uniref:Cytochrome c553 n=1 Tax=Pigmentiphaga kullae TaxID=151784 RepID=A0A4Q7NFY5_9BURK|nr:cytochrome c553 [Pigmentiphaga kullae]
MPFVNYKYKILGGLAAMALSAPLSAQQSEKLEPGTMAGRMAACTACHGEQGRAGPDGYYPRIAGKPADYLYNQLVYFRAGQRQYRPMQHLLENMSDEYLKQIAVWFSEQHPPYPDPKSSRLPAATLEHGRRLVMEGDRARGVPACVSCHGQALSGVLPAVPALLGLPHDYLSSQFGAWTNGLRKAIAPDCMADIARRLTPEDVSAVAGWLSSQPVREVAPAASLPEPMPMECGSQVHVGSRP